MEENYTTYDDERNKISWGKIFGILLLIIAIIIVILLLVKSCGKKDLRNDLIEAAKDYYEKYPEELPSTVGECYIVTLRLIEEQGLINSNDYKT